MKRSSLFVRFAFVSIFTAALVSPIVDAQQRRVQTATLPPLPQAPPQSVGFSAELPAQMDAATKKSVPYKAPGA